MSGWEPSSATAAATVERLCENDGKAAGGVSRCRRGVEALLLLGETSRVGPGQAKPSRAERGGPPRTGILCMSGPMTACHRPYRQPVSASYQCDRQICLFNRLSLPVAVFPSPPIATPLLEPCRSHEASLSPGLRTGSLLHR